MEQKNSNTFNMVILSAMKIPGVQIDRNSFLSKELSKHCSEDQVKLAVDYSPAYAGIEIGLINQIAEGCISFETNKACSISAVAGIPGGWAMAGTIPADVAQFYAHILRILQKLVYLYSWADMRDENGKFSDETLNKITIFMGVMFGINAAIGCLNKVAEGFAKTAAKKIPQMALTKTAWYPIVKKVASYIGIKISKDTIGRAAAKVIPLLGAGISAALTYFSFRPLAQNLKNHLSILPIADPNFYKENNNENIG